MVGGRPGTPTEDESTITASVQPAGNRKLNLPPAVRDSASLVAFSYNELRTAKRDGGLLADLVEFGGDRYEVVHVYKRTGPATLAHYEAYLARVSET